MEGNITKNRDIIREKQNGNLVPFEKGVSGNPNGRTKGQRNYATIYREALIKIGEETNKDPHDIEMELVTNAIKHAKKGSYSFYKDLMDRMYGKVEKEEKEPLLTIGAILAHYEERQNSNETCA